MKCLKCDKPGHFIGVCRGKPNARSTKPPPKKKQGKGKDYAAGFAAMSVQPIDRNSFVFESESEDEDPEEEVSEEEFQDQSLSFGAGSDFLELQKSLSSQLLLHQLQLPLPRQNLLNTIPLAVCCQPIFLLLL